MTNFEQIINYIIFILNSYSVIVNLISSFFAFIIVVITIQESRRKYRPEICVYIEKQNLDGKVNNSKFYLVFENISNNPSPYTQIKINENWIDSVEKSFDIITLTESKSISCYLDNNERIQVFNKLKKLNNNLVHISANKRLEFYLCKGSKELIKKIYPELFTCYIVCYKNGKKRKVNKIRIKKLVINEISVKTDSLLKPGNLLYYTKIKNDLEKICH